VTDNLFREKLAWFKQNEKPEAVLVVADNPELIKIAIAWTNMKVDLKDKITGLSSDSENEVWDWFWHNTRFRLSELKLIMGSPLSETGLQERLNPLIGNRIIYPDGTINSYVQRYLRERVVKLFESRANKSKKTG
jgi:hypothetical protein